LLHGQRHRAALRARNFLRFHEDSSIMQGYRIRAARLDAAPYAIKYTYAYATAQVSSDPREILGQRIAAQRTRKGWGQAELTQRVTGKARAATTSDWETGKKIPDALMLAA